MGGSFQKELFENVDPDNVPEVLGGNCNWSKYVDTSTCEPDSTGTYWFLSDRGPWDDTPGDEFWEAAKSQLKGGDQKEEVWKFIWSFLISSYFIHYQLSLSCIFIDFIVKLFQTLQSMSK